MNLLIREYRRSKLWHFKTKLILLFNQREFAGIIRSQYILRKFSEAFIFNVAILLPKVGTKDCIFIYHNPFPEINSTFTAVRNPLHLNAGFPQKMKNLHGHPLKLIAIEKPPEVIKGKDGQNLGTSAFLGDIILSAINATIQTEFLGARRGSPKFSVDDIPINRFPCPSGMVVEGFDYVTAKDQSQLRIIVTNTKPQHFYWLSATYYVNYYGRALCLSFVVYNIIYILFNYRQPNFNFLDCRLLPMWLRQPAEVRAISFKDRVFLASGLVFAFFTMSIFECHFTSNLVVNSPQQRVRSIEDLERSNIKIYSEKFVAALLLGQKYNLSSELLSRLVVTDESPWAISEKHGETWAYVMDKAAQKNLFNSVLNRDSYANQRFYLMDHIITTTPLLFLFPKDSPYKGVFALFHDRTVEAGLERNWETKVSRYDVWSAWRAFRISEDETPMIAKLTHMHFSFVILICGWSISLITLVLELFWSGQWSVKFLWSVVKWFWKRLKKQIKRAGRRQRKRVADLKMNNNSGNRGD